MGSVSEMINWCIAVNTAGKGKTNMNDGIGDSPKDHLIRSITN